MAGMPMQINEVAFISRDTEIVVRSYAKLYPIVAMTFVFFGCERGNVRSTPKSLPTLDPDEYDLVMKTRPVRLGASSANWWVDNLSLAKGADGNLIAAWELVPASHMEDAGAASLLKFASRVKGKWTRPQRLDASGLGATIIELVSGKAGVALLYQYTADGVPGVRQDIRVWRNGRWSDPAQVGGLVRPWLLSGKDNRFHLLWVGYEPGRGSPIVSSNFTHEVLYHSSYDGSTLSARKEVLDLSKEREGLGSVRPLAGANGAMEVIMVNPIVGLRGRAEKQGFERHGVSVVSFNPAKGKAEHTRLATVYCKKPRRRRNFACEVGQDDMCVVWEGPSPNGLDRQAALYSVYRTDGKWSKPKMIYAPEGGSSDVAAPEIIPVTVDGSTIACVMWGRDKSIHYLLGVDGVWSDVGRVETPWLKHSLGRAIEVAPGRIGIICEMAQVPIYFELDIVAKGTVVQIGARAREEHLRAVADANTGESSAGLTEVTDNSGLETRSQKTVADVCKAAPGQVWAWGFTAHEQLTGGNVVIRRSPAREKTLSGVTAIAAGRTHYLALKADGTVWAWGENGRGQLGDGSSKARNVPVKVEGLVGVVEVAAGETHSLALKADGTAWAWGGNDEGQLGDAGSGLPRHRPRFHLRPAKVQRLSRIAAIACGANHSLAVRTDGTVWSWGECSSGQLGRGIPLMNTQWWPTYLKHLVDITAIAAGAEHSVALGENASMWTWGRGDLGQLGNGTLGKDTHVEMSYPGATTPVQLRRPGGVVAIACGNSHSIAVRKDGTVWAWGDNHRGQLGDGTRQNRSEPAKVLRLGDVGAVAAGNGLSIALKTDGTVWAWGDNRLGQLGDGSTEGRRLLPTQVRGLAGVKAIAAGGACAFAITE